MLPQRPILARAAEVASWPALRERRWAPSALIERIGEEEVSASSAEAIARSSGSPPASRAKVTIRQLLSLDSNDERRHLLFDTRFFGRFPAFVDDFENPARFKDLYRQFYAFSAGSAGSGAGFHTHSASWFVVAHGTKEWEILPPNCLPGQEESHQRLSFTQEAGDEVLFIPAGWHHSTNNLETTIGVAGQASWQPGEAVAVFAAMLAGCKEPTPSILREYGAALTTDGQVTEGIAVTGHGALRRG